MVSTKTKTEKHPEKMLGTDSGGWLGVLIFSEPLFPQAFGGSAPKKDVQEAQDEVPLQPLEMQQMMLVPEYPPDNFLLP